MGHRELSDLVVWTGQLVWTGHSGMISAQRVRVGRTNRPTAVSLITNARHVDTARHVLFPARLVPLLAERSAQQR